jgi:hypothetical protein
MHNEKGVFRLALVIVAALVAVAALAWLTSGGR